MPVHKHSRNPLGRLLGGVMTVLGLLAAAWVVLFILLPVAAFVVSFIVLSVVILVAYVAVRMYFIRRRVEKEFDKAQQEYEEGWKDLGAARRSRRKIDTVVLDHHPPADDE